MPTIEATQDSGVAGGERIRFADVQLTNAQMLALRATPVSLVPAPGAGWALVVDKVYMFFDRAAAYTETADNLVIEYVSGADIMTVETTGFIDQATDQVRLQAPAYTSIFTPVANSGVRIANSGDGEFGGGNAANTVSIRVFYHVVPAAAFN